ncbi:hypothetical protein ACFXDH_17165 [Streptomyces sp. NPDC059467]|uniref:hypothetical protein n=1 Tax=Streptomyces sp. NPDC059467 TaxID=3346844 RepID=UPI003674DB33
MRHQRSDLQPLGRAQGTTGSHRQELMVGLFKDGLGVFNGTALKEALDLIEALALTEDVQPVYIRVAPGFDGATWLDLGRADGQSVRIHPTGWDIAVPDPREVCWRRTQLTGELPMPVKDTDGKGIDLLLRLCNFATAETECLAIAWLVGCLGPSVPVPAPFLTGPQGAGKSTGGRMLVRIIEGMTGDLRRAPKDEENLLAAVAAGWVTALDNLSHMSPDLSDAMCCIVTGAENVKRALFTDGDVFRVGYRRPLLLTGIDVGVIRPDLAERLLPLRLERPRVRRTEDELWTEYAQVLPVVLGSLLDLTVKVRAVDAESIAPTAKERSRAARTAVTRPPRTSTDPTGPAPGSSSAARPAGKSPTSSRSCRRRRGRGSRQRSPRWRSATT